MVDMKLRLGESFDERRNVRGGCRGARHVEHQTTPGRRRSAVSVKSEQGPNDAENLQALSGPHAENVSTNPFRGGPLGGYSAEQDEAIGLGTVAGSDEWGSRRAADLPRSAPICVPAPTSIQAQFWHSPSIGVSRKHLGQMRCVGTNGLSGVAAARGLRAGRGALAGFSIVRTSAAAN